MTLRSVFAINTCDCSYIGLLCVLYCSEVGRFRVGVGLGAPLKVFIYIKLFIFLQIHANINLMVCINSYKQPKTIKDPASWKNKRRRQGVLTKRQSICDELGVRTSIIMLYNIILLSHWKSCLFSIRREIRTNQAPFTRENSSKQFEKICI